MGSQWVLPLWGLIISHPMGKVVIEQDAEQALQNLGSVAGAPLRAVLDIKFFFITNVSAVFNMGRSNKAKKL